MHHNAKLTQSYAQLRVIGSLATLLISLSACGTYESPDGASASNDGSWAPEHTISADTTRYFNESYTNPTSAAHQLIARAAIGLLRDRRLLPNGVEAKIRDLDYGLSMADASWLGDKNAITLSAATYAANWPGQWVGRASDSGALLSSTVFVTWDKDATHPTPYLRVTLAGDPAFLLGDTQRRSLAADNMYHFPNEGTDVRLKDARLKQAGADERIFVPDKPVFEYMGPTGPVRIHRNLVGATSYGAVLYQLARKFWTANPGTPSIAMLPYAGYRRDAAFDQGRVKALGAEVPLPSTYLGGEPFVCANSQNAHVDPCRAGLPVWPHFVGFAPNLASPPKHDATALGYLGWAMHMIQDVSTGMHAQNWSGKKHEALEKIADQVAARWPMGSGTLSSTFGGAVDAAALSAFNAQVNALFGTTKFPRSRRDICREVGLSGTEIGGSTLNWQAVRPAFQSVAREAARDVYDAYNPNVSADENRAIVNDVARAVISSAKLLACLEPVL